MFVTVSDREGFVGAFASVAGARAALRPYAGVPFVYAEWPDTPRPPADEAADEAGTPDGAAAANKAVDEAADEAATADGGGGGDSPAVVWIVPYDANNAVAYAAASWADATRVQQALLRLELVPPDDVKYWEAAVGAVAPPAKKRLEAYVAACGAAGDARDAAAVGRFLDLAGAGEPAPEPARVDLLRFVVPRAMPL